jgi:hypothetical protein
MSGKIFSQSSAGQLTSMEEAGYDSEKVLQKLLATNPDLLAGDQMNTDEPRRWLLVTREMKVPAEEDGTGRWSLDHLFLDQDGMPTLVEVKKGTNTDVRRKVVGQMLDYAANAVAYWPVEEIRSAFESRCSQDGVDPDEELADVLGSSHELEDFWQHVKTNLQAGAVRLVFVADSIPVELRRVVEFLNEQMDPAEVLAVEVKQFVGSDMHTWVPRVIGQSEAARQKKKGASPAGAQWDEPAFMAALAKHSGEQVRQRAQDLLRWITPQVSNIWFGRGSKVGGIVPTVQHGKTKYQLCRLTTEGRIVFRLDWLRGKPPFTEATAIQELLTRIASIPGVQIPDQQLIKRIPISFRSLETPEATEKLKAVLSWLIAKTHEG